MNLWTVLKTKLRLNENNSAITFNDGTVLNYGELLQWVENLADQILEKTPHNSRICIINSHSCWDAICVLGTLAAGCTAVPLSLNYGEPNCCRIIKKVDPDLVLTNIVSLPLEIETVIKEAEIETLFFGEDKKTVLHVEIPVYENDLAMIMFTSGTTGKPKGAMLSHHNILSNLSDIADYFHLTPKDHILIVRPLYHAAVMTGEFLHAVISGSHITFFNEAFSPRRVLSVMEQIGCTVMCGTPTLFYHLASQLKGKKVSALQKIVVSGECLMKQVADKLMEAFPNTEFYNVFGLTEASPRVTYLAPCHFQRKVGSVGVPLKQVSIKVVDEKGVKVNQGEIGELIVNGPNVMQGYWNDKLQTESKIKDGWLYTGDLAYLDHDGFLYIVGRKDHMIIRAGMNIYPQEIENVMLENEMIKEVIAWGEPDPKYGQRICIACVSNIHGNLSEADIMMICRKKLQPYLWPDEVYILDFIPRNASGKLLRGRPINLYKNKEHSCNK